MGHREKGTGHGHRAQGKELLQIPLPGGARGGFKGAKGTGHRAERYERRE